MKVFTLFVVTSTLLVTIQTRTNSAKSAASSKDAITVKAVGRASSYLKFQGGRRMHVDYQGNQTLTHLLQSGQAQPRALAFADLDGNATPDLIAGYAWNGGGIVTVQRGNPEAYAPKDDSVFVRMKQGYNPAALLPQAETYQVPEAVDFVEAGDFNHDNRKDVLVGTLGGDLFLLAGDGQGGLSAPEQIALPGSVTTVVTGEFRATDGQPDVAVGVNGPNGAELLIYDGAAGGLTGTPMELALPAEATAVKFGELDSDPFMDLAVVTGGQVEIVHGWGRKQNLTLQSRVERVDAGSSIMGLSIGYFVWNREAKKPLAVLSDDGTIRILQRGEQNEQQFSDAEIAIRARARANQKRDPAGFDIEEVPGWQPSSAESWTTSREISAAGIITDAGSQNLISSSHISSRDTDDLMVLGGSAPGLQIVRQVDAPARTKGALFVEPHSVESARGLTSVNLDMTEPPVAVLALPQKLNGERSVIVLQAQSTQPTIVPLAPTATITVDRTDDPSGAALTAASACTAAANDCSLRGAIQFANANPGTVITLPAGTYTLNINGAGGCINESTSTGNTIGDLEINNSTTINGAGSASTIIRQLGAGGGGFTGDRVICLNVPVTAGALTWNFSGLTITGGRESSGLGGAGMVGGAKDNIINLTDVVFSNNQDTSVGNYDGAGLSITGGSVTITNGSIGGANAPGANRSDATLANAASQSGGGVGYSPGDPLNRQPSAGTLTITGTTFQHNTANSNAAGGGGLDVFTHNLGTGSVSVSGATFSNNQALLQNGGGIIIQSIATTVATTSFTSNTANNKGGGIYGGGGSLALDGTNSSITFSGNTAPGGGTDISTKATTTVTGTHTTLGGSIEVTTNGTWTNSNTGSSLNPTDLNVLGGVFTCNNSTMNISGNLLVTFETAGAPGGIFNANTGTVNLQGNLTVNNGGSTTTQFNGGTGNFNFTGNTAQSITATSSPTFSFNNLTDQNTTQPVTANNSFVVGGNLNVSGANAIFDPVAAAVISGSGTLTGTGTARVRLTGADAFFSQYTITNKTLTSLTVEYIGAAAQTGSVTTYGGLKINNASGVGLGAGTTIVNGTLTLTAGALAVSSNTLVINNGTSVTSGSLTSLATGTVNYNQGTNGQHVLAATYGNLTFSALTKVLASSGTIGIAGTFTTGGAAGHTITGSTIDFNGTGAQTVPAFSYNNLTISAARTVNNVTLVNGGTIAVAGAFSPTATFSIGSFIILNNTMDFNGAGAQTVAPFNYNSLTISGNRGGGAITLGNGNIGVAGTFNPSATSNTYTTTGNTVIFNGGVAQTIPAFTFNGLTLNNAAGANLGGDVTVGGALTLTAGALGVGTNTLTLNGAVSTGGGSLTSGTTGTVNYNQGSSGQATVLAANYGNLTFSNFNKTLASSGTIGIAGTFTPGTGAAHTITGSTINFNGAGAQAIPGFSYNNLSSSGGGVGRTLDPVNTIKIAGAFTPGTDTYTISGSTIEYNGTSAQSLPSSGFNTYNNLTLNNAAGTSGFAGLTVNGLIEVKAGTFTSSSSYNNVQIDSGATLAATAAATINVSGNWTNNGGTFTASTSTVNLNGAGSQTIGGTGTTTFNNLTVSNSNAISMTNDNTVNSLLALTSADITVSATKTLTQPVGGSSSGGFDVNGRVQRTGFVSGGAALSFGNPFNTIQVTAGTAPANIVADLARSAPGGFSTAVQRTYTIAPSAGGFTGTLRLHYLDAELNGNTEGAGLLLRRFNGSGWAPVTPSSFDTSANWAEKTGVTTFSPWTFSSCCSPTVASGVVGGRITDANGAPVSGVVVTLSGAQTRKLITDANGSYQFENIDTSGFYTVTPSRTNYSFSPARRSFTQEGNKTKAAFTGMSMGDSANPLDTAEYFVRQQYVDVLGREPDEAGFNYWSDQINACGGDAGCLRTKRIDVAASFFIAAEFQQSGSFLYDVYAGALGRRPAFAEYSADRQQVVGGANLETEKSAFAEGFVQRAGFITRYQSAMAPESFVDLLILSVQSSGGDLSGERSNLVGIYNQAGNLVTSRAAVVRSLADNATFKQSQYTRAFVLTEYFSYLQRDAEPDGYSFWVNVLNNGDPGNYRGMVCSFITSREYQNRFSSVISHTNGECGP